MGKKPNGYWTYKTCKNETLKYRNVSDLIKYSNGCYNRILKNKWYELTSHLKYKSNNHKRYIYSYEFPDNTVYIGLTYNLENRKISHLLNKKSPVFKHIHKTKLDYVYKKVYEDSFTQDVASLMEIRAVEYYKNNGWRILNTKKAGSLGGSTKKWTYTKIVKEFKNLKTLSEARDKLPHFVFTIIKNNGWWDELVGRLIIDSRIRGYWTQELALDKLKDYKTRYQLQKENKTLYRFLCKNKLLDYIPKVKPHHTTVKLKDLISKEEVYRICLQFNSGREIQKKCHRYYTCAKDNGWWEDIKNKLKEKKFKVK